MQTGRFKRIPQEEDCKRSLGASLKSTKAHRPPTTSHHQPHASDFPAKGRTRLLSRIVLTENSEFPHSVPTKGKGHHRKSVSLINEGEAAPLFAKVKRHRKLSVSEAVRAGTASTRHRRSASNRDRRREDRSSLSPHPCGATDQSHRKSLTLDMDSLETEYHEDALSNCSTKKIIMKAVQSFPTDLKLIAFIKRFSRLYGRPPPSSLGFYQLGGVIGKGAYSVVYSAVAKLTGTTVALKTVEKAALTDPRRGRKLTQEIEIMRHTRHPHLVKLYDIIETQSHIHLVLEFMGGGTFLTLVQTQGKLPEKTVKPLFLNIASGLKALHDAGVVHRDVKLENMLIGDYGAKLADFGVSKTARPGELLIDRVGTPSYLAPETLSDQTYAGQPADVWSLGVALYGLLCGTLPFKGFNYTSLHRAIENCVYSLPGELSRPAKDLLTRMLCADPGRRLTLIEVMQHPWLKEVDCSAASCPDSFDPDAFAATLKSGFSIDQLRDSLKQRDLNLATATYEMLRCKVLI